MKTTRLLLVFFCVLAFLSGCQKDIETNPPEDVDTINTDYRMYPKQIDVRVGKVFTIYWESNANSVIIITGQDTIRGKNPTNDSITAKMPAEGTSRVDGEFRWEQENGYPLTGKGSCYVIGHLPIKLSTESTQVPWGTNVTLSVETFDADSTNLGITSGTLTMLLEKDTTLVGISYQKGIEIGRDSITINVDDPTLGDTLCSLGVLHRDKVYIAPYLGGPYHQLVLDPCLLDDTRKFSCSPQEVSVDFGEILCNGQSSTGPGPWLIKEGDSIKMWDATFHLEIRYGDDNDTVEFISCMPGDPEVVKELFLKPH